VQPTRVEEAEQRSKADAPVRSAELLVKDQRAGAVLGVAGIARRLVTNKVVAAP
jgi:hypothetical protein